MNRLSIVLCLASAACALAFGDDAGPGDWLPAPDGYVWPKVVRQAPEFKEQRMQDLPAAVQEVVHKHWPLKNTPESIRIAGTDLNEDGREELFISIPPYGGSGGPYYMILTPHENTFRPVGGVQGWTFCLVEKKNGWLQIKAVSRSGQKNYTRSLQTFGKEGYETTRNEGHDFNTGTVTVRKPRL